MSGNSTSLARSLSSQPTSSSSSSSSLSALSLSSSSSSQALVLPSRCSPTSAGEQVSRLGDFSGGERVNIDPGDLASGVNGTFNADNDLDEGGNVALAQLQQRSENSEPLATNRCLDYDFTWNDVCGEAFTASLKAAYGEVVHWRRNIFMVPSGKVGKEFVREISRLLDSFTHHSALKAISLCAMMTLPHLLLQKTHAKSRSKENSTALERRLIAWRKGDLEALLQEGRAIQGDFTNSRLCWEKDEASMSRSFANLVHHGRTRAALRLLDEESRGGVLALDQEVNGKTVRELLKEKHPQAEIPPTDALTAPSNQQTQYHPVIFQKVTPAVIRAAALRVEGAAGPSGIDAYGWRRLCTSFGSASDDLCRAISDFTQLICSKKVPDHYLNAYTACRLVPLDKCPGVRPVGICEVLRRIVGKATMQVVGPRIQKVAGTKQLCAGQSMGIEAAIHAMRDIYADDNTEAVLMVDASNAFNRLNRQAAIHNIEQSCPALAMIIRNTYGQPIDLFVGGEVLKSNEGTTQGDPLAMSMYALGTMPLINELAHHVETQQVWFADDASDAGKLAKIKVWWDLLSARGPAYGYFPNASKTWLLVKDSYEQKARKIFSGTNINITTEGRRLLGAAIGETKFVTEYMDQMVRRISRRVETLAKIAKAYPQAAYTGFTQGLIGEWSFLTRTIGNAAPSLQQLEAVIQQQFIPTLTGRAQPGDAERDLLALPARHGGLGIVKPTTSGGYESSRIATQPLTKLIVAQQDGLGNVCADMVKLKSIEHAKQRKKLAEEARSVLQRLDPEKRRAAEQAAEKGASSWLTVLPIDRYGFALHKSAFRDALCLRYNWPPSNLPTACVCGQQFNSNHAMSCPTGGLPALRHNELRDITARLLQEICHDVETEPVLQSVDGEPLRGRCCNREDNARLDVAARGFWGSGGERAFFDIRVFNPCAPSHQTSQLPSLYRRQEKEKRRQYQQRVCEIERGSFTPLVFASSGGMGPAATTTYKRLAALLAEKRKASYSQTIAWVRALLTFSLLRSSILCLRGSRRNRNAQRINLPPVDLVASETRY